MSDKVAPNVDRCGRWRIALGVMPNRLRNTSAKCDGVLKPHSNDICVIFASEICNSVSACSNLARKSTLEKL